MGCSILKSIFKRINFSIEGTLKSLTILDLEILYYACHYCFSSSSKLKFLDNFISNRINEYRE